MATDWHKKVYKKKVRQTMNSDEWKKLRDACFERDKYTCIRCEKTNKSGRGMSAHHLIPRSEYGADDVTNLVTLCHECHDIVEIEDIRLVVDIIASYTGDTVEIVKLEDVKHGEESFVRPAWHKWVYGGQQHVQGEQ